MNVTFRTDKNILYIAIDGRIDASNAALAEEQISAIRKENEGKHTVIDADHLEYISSAGLRVILKIRKEEPKLAIINVAPEVYDVFDMTGFTDMVTVEKAYRRMSVEGCEFIAKGANGAVYRYDDETILKTYYSKDALPEIKQERESARKAFILGINTAIPYGIVRVGDGYGTVTELLNAVNVTRLLCDDPINIDKPVEYYVDLLKSIHATEAEEGDFPDMRETALGWADFVADYLPEAEGKKLRAMVEALPKQNTMMHGDYHTNNIMIQNGEMLWIDMEQISYGHPIYDLISIAVVLNGMRTDEMMIGIAGMDNATVARLKGCFIRKYFKTEDPEMIARFGKMFDALRMIRAIFAIGFTSSNTEQYRPAIIEMARQHFFPNIQNIVGGVKYLVSVIDKIHRS